MNKNELNFVNSKLVSNLIGQIQHANRESLAKKANEAVDELLRADKEIGKLRNQIFWMACVMLLSVITMIST
jgi:hypothetical protein